MIPKEINAQNEVMKVFACGNIRFWIKMFKTATLVIATVTLKNKLDTEIRWCSKVNDPIDLEF